MTEYGKKFLSSLIAAALSLVISIISLTVGFIIKPASNTAAAGLTDNKTSSLSSETSSGTSSGYYDGNGSYIAVSSQEGEEILTSGEAESDAKYVSGSDGDDFDPTVMTNKMKTAIWFSFYDLDSRGLNETQFKARINEMFDNAKVLCADTVICQVRPYSDAFYDSDIFPYSTYVSTTQGVDPGYDPLGYMVIAAHERGLKIEAWINPYRITAAKQAGTDLTKLADSNPAKMWLTDSDKDNDRNVLEQGGALYYNPSIPEVQELIIDGVREIVEKYAVDGIHFDDYFYPSLGKNDKFDTEEYNKYKNTTASAMSLDDWRRSNVNTLVSAVYKVVHSKGKTFGISPSYHISTDKSDDNYKYAYADIAMWMSNAGYIDYIAPQLYFGYEYPSEKCRFDHLLDLWVGIPKLKSVKLYIGVAAYKVGDTDAGSKEWIENDDILARQALDIAKSTADGIFIYNYNSIMGDSDIQLAERDKLITMFYEINRKS